MNESINDASNSDLVHLFLQFVYGKVLISSYDVSELTKLIQHTQQGTISKILDSLVKAGKLNKYYRLTVGGKYIICTKSDLKEMQEHTCIVTRNDTKQVYQIKPSDIQKSVPMYRVAQHQQKQGSLTSKMNKYLKNR